jgi:hypothetical protein
VNSVADTAFELGERELRCPQAQLSLIRLIHPNRHPITVSTVK